MIEQNRHGFIPYRLNSSVQEISNESLPAAEKLGPGYRLITRKGKEILLGEELGSGGEGSNGRNFC